MENGLTKPGDQVRITIPEIDKSVLEFGTGNATEHLMMEKQAIYILEKTEYPEEGGIYRYLKGMLYPEKGFPSPQAAFANNMVKRALIQMLHFFKNNPLMLLFFLRKKTRDNALTNFFSFASIVVDPWLLKEERYSNTAREIIKFSSIFLEELGLGDKSRRNATLDISSSAYSYPARLIAHMFEFDNAYMFLFQDIMNEANREAFLNNPRKEIKRLAEIFKRRETRESMYKRIDSLVFLIRLALLIPKVRRAFKKAFSQIDFKKLQMDESDRYHILRWDCGYNFLNKTFNKRIEEFEKLHNGNLPPMFIIQTKV